MVIVATIHSDVVDLSPNVLGVADDMGKGGDGLLHRISVHALHRAVHFSGGRIERKIDGGVVLPIHSIYRHTIIDRVQWFSAPPVLTISKLYNVE